MKKNILIYLSLIILISSLVACNNDNKATKMKGKEEIIKEETGTKKEEELSQNTKNNDKEITDKEEIHVNDDNKITEEVEFHLVEEVEKGDNPFESKLKNYLFDRFIFASVNSLDKEELRNFNIVDRFDLYEKDPNYREGDPKESILILPLQDKIYIKLEKVEYDSINDEFIVVEEVFDNYINKNSSNLLELPLVEGIPNFKITVEYQDSTIEFYNSYDGKNGNGIHYYMEDGQDIFLEWNSDIVISSEIVKGFYYLEEFEEIQKNLEAGMDLFFDNQYIKIDHEICLVFNMGTDHEENYVKEFYYAYQADNEIVYKYDPINDNWLLLDNK